MDTRMIEEKKVVVTGGAGFIGSHLCEQLVKLGANVISLDNYSAGKKENIDFLEKYSNFKAINKDITDTRDMDDIFNGVDIIFNNAASKKNICLIDPQKDLHVNGGGTLNILEYARKHNVKKFVHASSGSVYGEPTEFPSDESHDLRPVSYYGVSKLAGERYVDVFNRLYNLNTTILRYFHVYGPRQESNEFGGVVSIFLRQIIEGNDITVFGHGNQIRSFTWVKDLVDANIQAALNIKSTGKVYNTASGIKISINELAEKLVKMMNSKIKINHGNELVGDIMFFDVSNEAIMKDLEITFNQDFWGTMQSTLDDFQNYLKRII